MAFYHFLSCSMMAIQEGIYYDSTLKLYYPEGATHMSDFPEELLPVVNEHWANFPPQHPLIADCLGIGYFLLTFVCIGANCLVVYIYLSVKDLRTPANMLMVNLAISDLGIFVTQGPLMFINVLASPFWMWGSTMCRLYGCTGGIFGTVSIMTLVFIAYDRYQVICFGLGGKRMTPLRSFLFLLFIWTYSIAVCVPPYFGWGAYKLEGLYLTCSYEYLSDDWNPKSFLLFAFIFNYCVPLGAIIFFYEKIIVAIFFTEAAFKRAQTKLMDAANPPVDSKEFGVEKKIAKVALMNVMVWFLAWTPYATVCMIGCFGNRMTVTPLMSQIPAFGAKLASMFNPLVMMMSHPKYRYHLKEKCPWLCISEVDDVKEAVEETSSTNTSA